MDKKCRCMRLSVLGFGVSLGVISGLFMMVFALVAWQWGYGVDMMRQYTNTMPGYEASLKGCFMGLAWGFLEGFITGILWGWVYNLCLCARRCCCSSGKSTTVCEIDKTKTY